MNRKHGKAARVGAAPVVSPEAEADRTHRAPNGHERTSTTMRLRADLKAWLEDRARLNRRTTAAELEQILEFARRGAV